jgi:holo-[acyl-carrier protein] synthase
MIGIGIDLIEINRLAEIDQKIRARFINRVFSSAEQAICMERNECLAGRFAAKEAVSKALGIGIGEISWLEIEILQTKTGQPTIVLNGNALKYASELGVRKWHISITHDRNTAAAFVIAD